MQPGRLHRFDFDEDEIDILKTALRDHLNTARDTWLQQKIGTAGDIADVESLLNKLEGKE